MEKLCNFQLGKQGITESFIENLKKSFEKNKNIKVTVLKNARKDGKQGKKDVEKYSKEIIEKMGKNYTSRIIGFTISIKKWRRPKRE